MDPRRFHAQQNQEQGHQRSQRQSFEEASFPQFEGSLGRGQQVYPQQQPQYIQGTQPNPYLYPSENPSNAGYNSSSGFVVQPNAPHASYPHGYTVGSVHNGEFLAAPGYGQPFDPSGGNLGHFIAPQATALLPSYGTQSNHLRMPEPSRALTPQPNAYPSWAPMQVGRSSTPQPYQTYQMPQQITLQENNPPASVCNIAWSNLNDHLQKVQTSSLHTCSICPASFPRRTDLNRHIRSVHTNETPYKCLGCSAGFVRSDARGRHWKETPACKELHIQRSE
jgi:uncharacterized Zn-finger protein